MTKHDKCGHPAYNTWHQMVARCYKPKSSHYSYYGGRGITVCARWRESFQAFWDDIGSTWKEGLSLDRIDNNGNYSPENCRWATHKEQMRNMRRNLTIDTPKGPMLLVEAVAISGIQRMTLKKRLQRGWPAERLFDKPRKMVAAATAASLILSGCASTRDLNYAAQLESYRLTISSQREVEVARAKAEEARYVAMATIAERADAQTKSMALFALALSGRGEAQAQNVAVQLPTIPRTQEDRALAWASIFAGPTTALVSSYFGYRLGQVQSNNQAQTTQASYAALVAFKPAPPSSLPTSSVITTNNITSTYDLWNRDGFVNVGGAGQQAPTTATQDNSPVVVVPPVFNVPVIVPGP